MTSRETHVVTGAFGYSGRYIAQQLLEQGIEVRTLTNSLHRENPFGDKVKAFSYNFQNFSKLVETLQGTDVLYNTYWVRFNHKQFNHQQAVENTKILFKAAKQAGVKRIIHTSITNPSLNSPYEYFSGKAELEEALISLEVPYTILRPAVLFGGEDILINNIAWLLRNLPVFGVFSDGRYSLQPIHVEDFATLAVEESRQQENRIIDAIGPETFTYRELVRMIAETISQPRPVISVPPAVGYLAGSLLGLLLDDVVITRAEIEGLMANLLYTPSPPAGTTRLTVWAKEHANSLGRHYASELQRRRDTRRSYAALDQERKIS